MSLHNCDQLWDDDAFASYSRYCDVQGYCAPWHPYVGPKYGQDGVPRLLYCGGAAWWKEANVGASRQSSIDRTEIFISENMYSSAFWRLFDRLSAIVNSNYTSRADAIQHASWTNLSKTGLVGLNSPPDRDKKLRCLDIAQCHKEFKILKPDILVCVSGSLVPSTGFALFSDWEIVKEIKIETTSTWIRRAPWGGYLLWTMHPAFKPAEWTASVEQDLRTCLSLLEEAKR